MSKSLANSILALLVITWLAVGCGSGNGAGSGAAYPETTATDILPRPRRNVPIRG